jgi:hypothetical protein
VRQTTLGRQTETPRHSNSRLWNRTCLTELHMSIEICLGRGLALLVHPAAAWRRLPIRGRVILLSAYATVSYVAVLTGLLAL